MNSSSLVQSVRTRVSQFARWYVTPSGLVLAVSLVCLILFSLDVLPTVLGPAGLVALAMFLPYRFARQEQVVFDVAAAERANSERRIAALSALLEETQQTAVAQFQATEELVGDQFGDLETSVAMCTRTTLDLTDRVRQLESHNVTR